MVVIKLSNLRFGFTLENSTLIKANRAKGIWQSFSCSRIAAPEVRSLSTIMPPFTSLWHRYCLPLRHWDSPVNEW
ncbi:Uncharacterised protein [Vibrio cholerae]|nr:Uncharacterised protein [Vibrio cholerae]CSC37511.1 Uncharacterised protein [Vibrio cholerae]CSI55898.1 Uncharacterised protein [Vibrio cholerae]CSI76026.1 Uncharacterised protein [Vibrio cholerae]